MKDLSSKTATSHMRKTLAPIEKNKINEEK